MELTIEQTLQQGVAAHKEGKRQEAERLYRAILQVQPKHSDANHNLGVLAVSVNKTEAALPLFKTALEANPKIEQFWLSYIDALIKEKQFDNAKEVLEQGKNEGVAKEKLKALTQKLVSVKAGNIPIQAPSQAEMQKLINHYQNGQYGDAEKMALLITQKFPENQFAWKVLGALLGQKDMKAEALNANQKAVQLEPQDAEAHYNLGNTLMGLGRLEEAVASYRQAIALKSDYAEALNNLGITLKALGRLEEAEASYRQAIALKPNYAEAYTNLGATLRNLGRLEEAEASLRQAIALKSDFAEAHSNLGATLQALGKLEESEASYRQAIALKSDFAEAHYNLGITLQALGRLEEAEASYRQAIALKPDYAEAHYNLGVTLQELGRLDGAEASYGQAIALKPDYAEAYSNLGATLQALGRLEEAEASFRQAIALKPNYAKAYTNLGATLQNLGRLEEAEASLRQAIALKPDCATTAQNMVKLPVGQLDLKILDLCDKALFVQSESVKNQASYYFSQANLLKHKGLMEQSFDEFCKANKLRWEEVREQFATHDRRNTGNLNRIRQWTPNVPELVEGRLTKLFLMGPSRSGKTSLEHVLSKSYQVKPLYEGINFSGLSKDFVNGKDSCERLFEKIFFQSEDEFLCQGYKVVTSTHPDSIFYSDYLIDMLPNTYFLIIRRDLRDVASEIFTTEYVKEHFYSYDPNGISTYLGVYNKICEALALKVPDRCITISFEDIINSPEDTIERIGGLVCRNFEVGRLKKYVTSFTSESLFRDHFAGIKKL